MSGQHRRGWVLGAGFSKALGGPLLGDLLSWNARGELRARHGELPRRRGAEIDLIYWLFHFGTQFRDGAPENDRPLSGVRAWDDAEEFLELLDLAATSPAAAAKLRALKAQLCNQRPRLEWSDIDPTALGGLAKRLAAVPCCSFLADVDRDSVGGLERWHPYRDWFRFLGGADTLVSFNYDRVVERLHGALGVSLEVPISARDVEDLRAAHGRTAALLKLHGSVDWRRSDDDSVRREPDGAFSVFDCEDGELALATPGPSKARIAGQLFEALWRQAECAIRAADELFFVGYRFPPSDAEARQRLLRAIQENDRPHLDLHVVLGPRVGDAAVVRLEALLRATARRAGRSDQEGGGHNTFRMHVHPMWAEDFLSVWHPEYSTTY